jgi:hypothetical protein
MRNTRIAFFSALLALSAVASGCGTLGTAFTPVPVVKQPQVEVTAISMEAFSARGVGGQMELSVANPNTMDLRLRYIEWRMSVGGDQAVGGTIGVREDLPAKGAKPLSIPLEVLADDAFRVVPHLNEGDRDYQLTAVLHYRSADPTADGSMKVAFQSSGVL